MASIMVDSSVSGADIEVDGNFVGNTPSKVEVTPGSHAITVKKKRYQNWTRTMNVSGTGAKVNAELDLAVVERTSRDEDPLMYLLSFMDSVAFWKLPKFVSLEVEVKNSVP